MLGLAHAENHKGPEGMLTQLRGKVFWPWMGKQAHKMVNRCEPCQRLARSNVQEDVEISHDKLFNTHPGETACELEEEVQLIHLIQKRIGRK